MGLLAGKCVLHSSEDKVSHSVLFVCSHYIVGVCVCVFRVGSSDSWTDARFLVSLSESFNSSVQLSTIVKLLDYITLLPQDKPEGEWIVSMMILISNYCCFSCA